MKKMMLHKNWNTASAEKAGICFFILLFLTCLVFGMSPVSVSANNTATIISGDPVPGHQYAVLVQDPDDPDVYYMVHNHEELVPVKHEAGSNTVTLDYPLLWTYTSAHDHLNDNGGEDNAYSNNQNPPYNLRIAHNARAYDDFTKLAQGFLFRYISPQEADGVFSESVQGTHTGTAPVWGDHVTSKYTNGLYYSNHNLIGYTCTCNDPGNSSHSDNWNCSQNNNYIGFDKNQMHLTGLQSSGNAAKIYFAEIQNIPTSWSQSNETVSHIDIGVDAVARLDLPLAYGKYYDSPDPATRNLIYDVSHDHPVTITLQQDIDVGEEELMVAEIEAIDKNGDPVSDAFYITGYSANQETVLDPVQVRLEGIYKVDTLGPYTGSYESANQDPDRRSDRLNNQVYYRVSVLKDTAYYLLNTSDVQRVDGNGNLVKVFTFAPDGKTEIETTDYKKLYDEDGNELKVNVTVRIADVFSYWDEHNECPPLEETFEEEYCGFYPEGCDNLQHYNPQTGQGTVGRNHYNWQSGAIFDNTGWYGHWLYIGDSGMDFRLGFKQDTLAIEMTKVLQDENGNRISPVSEVTNVLDIYQSSTDNPNRVIDYAVFPDSVESGDISYPNYNAVRTDWEVVTGPDGVGVTYLYNISQGMYYVSEHPDLMQSGGENHLIVDADGKTWVFKETRMDTEYAWRQTGDEDKVHSANGNSAVPEVLGPYGTGLENTFLEFFIYNIYEEALTDLELTKTWVDNNNQDGYRLTAEQYKAKLHLLADGVDVTTTYADNIEVTDNTDGTYTVTVSGIPQYSAGVEITYTMTEDAIAEYTPNTTDPQGNNGGWTNTHTPEETELTLTKTWVDANNQDGYRLTADQYKAKLHLWVGSTDETSTYASNIAVTDNGNNTFTVSVTGLPKKANGVDIVYTMTEDAIAEYTTSPLTAQVDGGFWTNTHTPEEIELTLTKTWVDNNNQDGYRLTAEQYKAKLHLFAGNTEVTSTYASNITVTDNGDGTFTVEVTSTYASNITVTDNGDGTFTVSVTGLPKKANGTDITYTMTEDAIAQYTTTPTTAQGDGGGWTNTHTPEVTQLTLTKIWVSRSCICWQTAWMLHRLMRTTSRCRKHM